MIPTNPVIGRGPVSSRSLLAHSKEAMLAAIEIYNKPTISYRNECTVILIVNSWELVLKALLVANKQAIHDDSVGLQWPTRTITWRKAWHKSKQFLPRSLANPATQHNLEVLAKYRDQAIHCYNSSDLAISLYFLFQAAIVNYRHLVEQAWSTDIAKEMTWHLLPIGITPPTDIVSFLDRVQESSDSSAVSTFLAEIGDILTELKSGEHVDRFLIRATVQLESVKKTDQANIVIGVDSMSGDDAPGVVYRRQDPNQSHPFRQKDVLAKIERAGDKKLTSYVFQAIVWKYQLKSNSKYCWTAKEGILTRYSSETVILIQKLSAGDVEEAVTEYRDRCRKSRQVRS